MLQCEKQFNNMKTGLAAPQKLNTEMPLDSAIPILGKPERIESRDSNTFVCNNFHSNIIHDGQKVVTTEVSINT